MRWFPALALVCLASPAFAAMPDLDCTNAGLEVQCSDGECSASEGFTPIAVSLSAEVISVCAYSGCWQGRPVVHEDRTGVMILGRDLEWIGTSTGRETFRIAVSYQDMMGMVLGGPFAQPVICEMAQGG